MANESLGRVERVSLRSSQQVHLSPQGRGTAGCTIAW
jgi:hypothetical protein